VFDAGGETDLEAGRPIERGDFASKSRNVVLRGGGDACAGGANPFERDSDWYPFVAPGTLRTVDW